jgi:hypothetical protein
MTSSHFRIGIDRHLIDRDTKTSGRTDNPKLLRQVVEAKEGCGLFWRENADDQSINHAKRWRDFSGFDCWDIMWVGGGSW